MAENDEFNGGGATVPPLSDISDALLAQQTALAELVRLTEKQADLLSSIVFALRALCDVCVDDEQRRMLEKHLATTGVTEASARANRALLDALLA